MFFRALEIVMHQWLAMEVELSDEERAILKHLIKSMKNAVEEVEKRRKKRKGK